MAKRKKTFPPEIKRVILDYEYVETPKGFHINVVSNILKNDPDTVFIDMKYHLAWNVVHRRSSFPDPQNAFRIVADAFFDCSSSLDSFVSLLWLAPDHPLYIYTLSQTEKNP